MAKIYFEKLIDLVHQCKLKEVSSIPLEVKHFFSGAALYINDEIGASLSPTGIAFKLEEDEVHKLIASKQAIPLKYFPKGNIKKGYALFENPNLSDIKLWKSYFIKSIYFQDN